MSDYSILEPTLNELLRLIKPLREDWEMRFKILNELREVVQSVESLRGAIVEPFGSFVSNLFTRWGDLDISIELTNGSCISSAGKKLKQNLLEEFLRALRQKGGFRRLQFIPNARVPILKFEHNHNCISCDISIDNLHGQMKSKFLFWINEIDGRFRDMILLVKEWAKAHNINDPKSGTLNSYSLSLLVVFHFQTCVPAILPPLRDIYPRNVVEDLTGLRANAERHIAEICAANIARFKSDKSRAINRSSLSELFISFLGKFSDISSKASELGICPFTGRWEDIRSNTRWLPKTYAIFIEDPFEQPENTARAVSARQLNRICDAFEMSRNRLIMDSHNQGSLLATLARPQTLHFIARTTYNGGHKTRPVVPRATHSPLQLQPRFQNTRPLHSPLQTQLQFHNTHSPPQVQHRILNTRPLHSPQQSQLQYQNAMRGSRPNNPITQRPVQHYHSQGQQMWRPKSEK